MSLPKEVQDQCWGMPAKDQYIIWAKYGYILSGSHRIYVPWRVK